MSILSSKRNKIILCAVLALIISVTAGTIYYICKDNNKRPDEQSEIKNEVKCVGDETGKSENDDKIKFNKEIREKQNQIQFENKIICKLDQSKEENEKIKKKFSSLNQENEQIKKKLSNLNQEKQINAFENKNNDKEIDLSNKEINEKNLQLEENKSGNNDKILTLDAQTIKSEFNNVLEDDEIKSEAEDTMENKKNDFENLVDVKENVPIKIKSILKNGSKNFKKNSENDSLEFQNTNFSTKENILDNDKLIKKEANNYFTVKNKKKQEIKKDEKRTLINDKKSPNFNYNNDDKNSLKPDEVVQKESKIVFLSPEEIINRDEIAQGYQLSNQIFNLFGTCGATYIILNHLISNAMCLLSYLLESYY
ncbi:hypothetical protein GVAV_002628 [Gurleya vavrai]